MSTTLDRVSLIQSLEPGFDPFFEPFEDLRHPNPLGKLSLDRPFVHFRPMILLITGFERIMDGQLNQPGDHLPKLGLAFSQGLLIGDG